jgi:hypothetical protein
MKPVLRNETVFRIQKTVDEPISRGMDLAINKCLDELDILKAKKIPQQIQEESKE